jgi:hypothetical protein
VVQDARRISAHPAGADALLRIVDRLPRRIGADQYLANRSCAARGIRQFRRGVTDLGIEAGIALEDGLGALANDLAETECARRDARCRRILVSG